MSNFCPSGLFYIILSSITPTFFDFPWRFELSAVDCIWNIVQFLFNAHCSSYLFQALLLCQGVVQQLADNPREEELMIHHRTGFCWTWGVTRRIYSANHKGHKRSSRPIRTQSKARENVRRVTFMFTSDWLKQWRTSFWAVFICQSKANRVCFDSA